MNKLGEKIKEIRIKNGLSQEAFAKELGYTSRSTINKIEKGINEISYEKLLLLLNKYEVEIDELFDKKKGISFIPNIPNYNLFVSFSARDYGNCSDIAKYLMNDNDTLVHFKDLFYNPCSKCNYECFSSTCKYRDDDLYNLFDSIQYYKTIIFLVPMYCGNPSSLFFVLLERMQDYFSKNENKWDAFLTKLHFICIYGSDEETPYFIEHFKSLVEENKILKIERHKYKQKMNDRIIENIKIIRLLDKYKERINL